LSRPEAPGGLGSSIFAGDRDEPVFREPWEAQVFSIAVALSERGVFTWSEWADVLAGVIADPASAELSYYDQWLRALEKLVMARRLVDETELDERRRAWRAAALATPHGKPIVLPSP
jgi:nitrile hydratase accessory protein